MQRNSSKSEICFYGKDLGLLCSTKPVAVKSTTCFKWGVMPGLSFSWFRKKFLLRSHWMYLAGFAHVLRARFELQSHFSFCPWCFTCATKNCEERKPHDLLCSAQKYKDSQWLVFLGELNYQFLLWKFFGALLLVFVVPDTIESSSWLVVGWYK